MALCMLSVETLSFNKVTFVHSRILVLYVLYVALAGRILWGEAKFTRQCGQCMPTRVGYDRITYRCVGSDLMCILFHLMFQLLDPGSCADDGDEELTDLLYIYT
jgi:hypothetical protein